MQQPNFLLPCGFAGRGSEIAEKYQKAGKLEEALKYADPDEQTELRAQCLLSLARQKLAQYSQRQAAVVTPPVSPGAMPRLPEHALAVQLHHGATSPGPASPVSPGSLVVGARPLAAQPTSPSGDLTQRPALSAGPNASLAPLQVPASPTQVGGDPQWPNLAAASPTSRPDKETGETSPALPAVKSFASAVTGKDKSSFSSMTASTSDSVSDGQSQVKGQGQVTVPQDARSPQVDDPNVEAARRLLKEAIQLSRDGDSANSGEAKLLLGTLDRDIGTLRDALKDFTAHDIGYIECTGEMVRLDRGLFRHDFGSQVIMALKKVMSLLGILDKTREQLSGHNQLKMLYRFYGLQEKTYGGSFQVMWTEGARIIPVLQKSGVGLEPDDATVRDVLQDILLKKASGWITSLRSSLEEEITRNTQCGNYMVGRRCPSPGCPFLHTVRDKKTHIYLLRNLLAMIKLNSMIEKSLEQAKGQLSNNLKTFTTPDPWKWCNQLYNALYPRHTHPYFLMLQKGTVERMLKDLRLDPVKSYLLKYVDKRWSEAEGKCRHSDTDLLLKIHTIHCLVGKGTESLAHMLREEEIKYRGRYVKKYDPVGYARQHSLGFWIHGRGEKLILYTYLGNFHKAINKMHKQRDPIEGLAKFNQFFSFILESKKRILVPSPGNTVRLMEIMTMLIMAIYLHVYRGSSAVVPVSYIAALNAWDAELGGDTYDNIHNSNTGTRGFKGRIAYMVKLLCGELKNSEFYPGPLKEAFDSNAPHWLKTGEAERVLVLVLVLLVNSDIKNVFFQDCQWMLLHAIAQIPITPALEEYPRGCNSSQAGQGLSKQI